MEPNQTSSNPFFKTVNGGYGQSWQASGGAHPLQMHETPEYKDLVRYPSTNNRLLQGERELALKNSMRTYKHEILKEMRENGELDTQIYGKIKADMNAVKKQDVIPKPFPAATTEMRYPEHALNVGSLLYRSSNMGYGSVKPQQ